MWIRHEKSQYIYIHISYLFVLVLPVKLLRPTFPPCSSKSRVQEIDKSSRDRLVHTRQDRWRNFQDPIIQGLDSTVCGSWWWISKWLRFTLQISGESGTNSWYFITINLVSMHIRIHMKIWNHTCMSWVNIYIYAQYLFFTYLSNNINPLHHLIQPCPTRSRHLGD